MAEDEADAVRRVLEILAGDPLVYRGAPADGPRYACCCAILVGHNVIGSGVLVGETTVLTAAHVLVDTRYQPPPWRLRAGIEGARVYAGDDRFPSGEHAGRVVPGSIRVHPSYDVRHPSVIRGALPKLDAALMAVDRPLPGKVAQLAGALPALPAHIEVVGFGASALEERSEAGLGERRSAGLYLGSGDVTPTAEERGQLGFAPPVEFTFGHRPNAEREEHPDTRGGDSGGPVLLADGSVIGVTCRGALPERGHDGTGKPRNCGVYLSIPAVHAWITGTMQSMRTLLEGDGHGG